MQREVAGASFALLAQGGSEKIHPPSRVNRLHIWDVAGSPIRKAIDRVGNSKLRRAAGRLIRSQRPAPGADRNDEPFVVYRVDLQCLEALTEIGEAFSRLRIPLGTTEHRQKNPNQQRNNSNHDQQLDQRKRTMLKMPLGVGIAVTYLGPHGSSSVRRSRSRGQCWRRASTSGHTMTAVITGNNCS